MSSSVSASSSDELRLQQGAKLGPRRLGQIAFEGRHVNQQGGRRDPVIVAVEMTGLLAAAAELGK